jgi:hypothetical protein
VEQAAARLRQTCWIHWLDAVDIVFSHRGEVSTLRLTLQAPREEWPVFEAALTKLLVTDGLTWVRHGSDMPLDGLPDFVVRTTPEAGFPAAHDLARHGWRIILLTTLGVIHGYLEAEISAGDPPKMMRERLAALRLGATYELGDWSSRHLPMPDPGPTEAAWIERLREAFVSP